MTSNPAAAGAIHVLVRDLLLQSKVRAAITAVAAPASFHSDLQKMREALHEARAFVIVDLNIVRVDDMQALAELVGEGHQVIGFVSHVDVAHAKAARATGCRVMPRSQFFSQLPTLLQQATQ